MHGRSPELDDASFDAVACGFARMPFPDRAKGCPELFRVLRPGGRAEVIGWAGPDKFEGFGLFPAAMDVAFPDMPPPPSPPQVCSLADPADFKFQGGNGGRRFSQRRG